MTSSDFWCHCGVRDQIHDGEKPGFCYRCNRRIMGEPITDRLRARFQVGDGCWEWTGRRRAENSYGHIGFQGRNLLAHRLVYELLVGPIPDGHELDHLCRNKGCVNPDHLEVVTHQENMKRLMALKTHCPSGHEYTEANIYWYDGRRLCRRCRLGDRAEHRRGLGKGAPGPWPDESSR